MGHGELIHTSRRYDDRAAVALLALRDRLAPEPTSYLAEEEGINTSNFHELSERVEYGDEQWEEPAKDDDEEPGEAAQ